jgi:hypothetical protein
MHPAILYPRRNQGRPQSMVQQRITIVRDRDYPSVRAGRRTLKHALYGIRGPRTLKRALYDVRYLSAHPKRVRSTVTRERAPSGGRWRIG